eukprot:gnl/MRDRNA2_/MRDRNA2_65755_c0_seq1.p1 gnl/MRDRNA2_/MRDRNA2_65755_c0~~gnl/MRDRNA2_/MRDRNA2_65755_c0_seq1.p1  ORF type:complete len:951 (-),score=197.04 gnl/MRDRNA2_/MRDRNA2_65755_c0_seq1:179-3031(-)
MDTSLSPPISPPPKPANIADNESPHVLPDGMSGTPRDSPDARKSSAYLVVLTVRGKDQPGILDGLLKVVVDNDCQLLDMAQVTLNKQCENTYLIDIGRSTSMAFFKDVVDFGKIKSLNVHFNFFDGSNREDEGVSNFAVVSIVGAVPIFPPLLHGLDLVLQWHRCPILEIEHRSDNKMELNGQYNKLEFRISCPQGFKLAGLYLDLQVVAWKAGFEIAVRWWDGLHRPNLKSIVAISLSNVLVPVDVMNELLKEAGVPMEGGVDELAGSGMREWNPYMDKVSKLKGKSTKAVQRLIDRLEFTPGARLVCRALGSMGFRLAITTNSGVRAVAEYVKQQLGCDYVICQDLEVDADGNFTGKYVGDATDVRFRKADVLQLTAEKEGVDYRNIISCGHQFLDEMRSDLKSGAENLQSVLDSFNMFGPHIYFKYGYSGRNTDLTSILYLMGLHGREVIQLRRKYAGESANSDKDVNWMSKHSAQLQKLKDETPKYTKLYRVRAMSPVRSSGQIAKLFSRLLEYGKDVSINTIRQGSLLSGGMSIMMSLRIGGPHPIQMLKELLYSCLREGFQMDYAELDRKDLDSDIDFYLNPWPSPTLNQPTELFGDQTYVLTLVKKPFIDAAALKDVTTELQDQDISIAKMDRLSVDARQLTALQMVFELPQNQHDPRAELTGKLQQISRRHGIDIAFQADSMIRWSRRLVVFDMDSTLIQQEVIDELAAIAGVKDEVKKITEAAMRGELDFFQSLQSRVALLKGFPAEKLFNTVKHRLTFTPGARKLCSTLKVFGYKMAVVSGGFLPLAREVQKRLGLDYAFANNLEVDADGCLTGTTTGAVVTPERKKALLSMIANVEQCMVEQTIAVGDGANDIPMLNHAGLGIAFCAKPKVQEATEFRINQRDLSNVLFLIGLSEHAAARLNPLYVGADLLPEKVVLDKSEEQRHGTSQLEPNIVMSKL